MRYFHAIRRRSDVISAAMLCFVTLLIAACGGSSNAPTRPATTASPQAPANAQTTASTPTASTSRPRPADVAHTPATLVVRANAICAGLSRELETEHPRNAALPEVDHHATLRAATEERAVIDLGKLTPPASLEREWQQILTIRQSRVENLRSLARYAAASDEQGVSEAVAVGERLKAQLREADKTAGLSACSEVG